MGLSLQCTTMQQLLYGILSATIQQLFNGTVPQTFAIQSVQKKFFMELLLEICYKKLCIVIAL